MIQYNYDSDNSRTKMLCIKNDQKLTTTIVQAFVERFERFLIKNGSVRVIPA